MSKVWVDLPLVKNNTSQGPVLKCGTLHTLYLIENPQETKIVFNKTGNIKFGQAVRNMSLMPTSMTLV